MVSSRLQTLVLALECDHPERRSLRIDLDGATTVTVGREARAGTAHRGSTLHVGLADPHASARHAVFEREHGRWCVKDLASKNGTLVNGERHLRRLLEPGDVIEVGHSLFLYLEERALGSADADEDRFTEVPPDADGLFSLSRELDLKLAAVASIARTELPLLIEGPPGVGKERVARAMHARSGRSGPFVAVSFTALPAERAVAELCETLRRAARGGTVLLDEVGDLAPAAQPMLLRALQARELAPLDGGPPLALDVRFISTTHRDLDALASSGAFREDLLTRLCGYRLELPPLAARRADLGSLVASLLSRSGQRLTVDAGRALLRYGWPRNLRQLKQALAVATVTATEGIIGLEHLPAEVNGPPVPALSPEDEARRDQLASLLREHHGNVTRVAEAMGKARMQIQRWVRRFDLSPAEFRK
ncbi:MAG: sigma 54-interacting transcriptional regulator [Archangiaceae bacterium]|nr:sigma 54-interacting transcriptional regulator [Archangiaceae bacterium]